MTIGCRKYSLMEGRLRAMSVIGVWLNLRPTAILRTILAMSITNLKAILEKLEMKMQILTKMNITPSAIRRIKIW